MYELKKTNRLSVARPQLSDTFVGLASTLGTRIVSTGLQRA